MSDLNKAVQWADTWHKKWAFTLSNAGAYYFEDRADLSLLNDINWPAVHSNHWTGEDIPPSVKEGKQAEFLIEDEFPWEYVESIGVYSKKQLDQVNRILGSTNHRPLTQVKQRWYY